MNGRRWEEAGKLWWNELMNEWIDGWMDRIDCYAPGLVGSKKRRHNRRSTSTINDDASDGRSL